ncbi:glycosyltransferase family 1 protein [Sphingosinicella sp. CPCC 101087]|uniref:glycosyltransferase family 4 protein n=1 Tax=Sphingosinicella sp. CPCC 101087 TaxID=2497754 RepID=UPI00101BB022|nr:glycosyltransferase family 1 protein [Sphingosinicella sp. CPCC 101087]
MRIALVTDAWEPQVNGVVRTLRALSRELERAGHSIVRISPEMFRTIACPTYSEIRLALLAGAEVARRLQLFRPDAIHIATEGPLGLAARRWCIRGGHAFTTAYHTRFPEYLASRTHLPATLFWPYIRWFHAPAARIMTSTPAVAAQLAGHGLDRTHHWGRGVDVDSFRPGLPAHPAMEKLPRPIQLYVGRVAIEKNLEAFLGCRHPGSKVVVGDGPAFEALRRRFPSAHFLGALDGAELASAYGTADVFVFPSRTDTFGLVLVEALACGTPVAAFPVPGPADILSDEVACLDEDLDEAIAGALTRVRYRCDEYAARFSWSASARQFLAGLEPLPLPPPRPAQGGFGLGREREGLLRSGS